jgi:hypothetical protein
MTDKITILDEYGNELRVGSKAIYGCPEPGEVAKNTVTVIEITDPDGDVDDDTGRSIEITPRVVFRFPDGDTDKVSSLNITPGSSWHYDDMGPFEMIYEVGDLEWIKDPDPHTHTHTIKDGKTVCVYCGEELEL